MFSKINEVQVIQGRLDELKWRAFCTLFLFDGDGNWEHFFANLFAKLDSNIRKGKRRFTSLHLEREMAQDSTDTEEFKVL